MSLAEAKLKWVDGERFAVQGLSGHAIVTDASGGTAANPMELVLMGLCACTATDVVSILRKKREALCDSLDLIIAQSETLEFVVPIFIARGIHRCSAWRRKQNGGARYRCSGWIGDLPSDCSSRRLRGRHHGQQHHEAGGDTRSHLNLVKRNLHRSSFSVRLSKLDSARFMACPHRRHYQSSDSKASKSKWPDLAAPIAKLAPRHPRA